MLAFLLRGPPFYDPTLSTALTENACVLCGPFAIGLALVFFTTALPRCRMPAVLMLEAPARLLGSHAQEDLEKRKRRG